MSEENEITDEPPRRGPSLLKLVLPLALLLVVTAVVTVLLVHGSSSPSPPGGVQRAKASDRFYGTLALPRKAAPPIALRNYLGQPVTLAQYRGRAVLVTFIYTHCPDVCPLIVANLRVALNELGPQAKRAQVIAISVDPRGDTPATVARFLRAHEMVGRMQYLIGSSAQLQRTWAAWSVGSSRVAGNPDLVEHSALIYGISAGGALTTLYPASFEPAQIVHDVPRLAAL
ncbi:MAG TPA: SCO family protein [Solirubrobacteraceae bacterium]